MGISQASHTDLKGIRDIWEERFTTDKEYLEIMFNRIMPFCTSYVYKNEAGKILSAASFMPMEFIDTSKQKSLEGWYMFGVATLENASGNRLAAKTILYAIDKISTKGYHFIFERPANQDLNSYYLKLGFSKPIKRIPFTFKTDSITGSSGNKQGINKTKYTAQCILEQIEEHFKKRFVWKTPDILEGLIEIGEVEYHNSTLTSNTKEATFIAINPLNGIAPEIFNNAFFCFPME